MKTNSSKNNINRNDETINRKLNSIDVNAIARQTGFQKREAKKITPVNFLISHFRMAQSKGSKSLRSWAERLSFMIHDKVSATAVFKKMKDEEVEFLKKVLEKAINQKAYIKEKTAECLKIFGKVLLQDSTCLSLDDNLQKAYPGSSNQNGKQSPIMKLQVIYDVLKGIFKDFRLSSYRDTDYKHSMDILDYADKGDLVLRDLGYFIIKIFKAMSQRGIYFISKLKPSTIKLYDNDDREIDLCKLIGNKAFIDKRLKITEKHKYSVRLIAIRLDDKAIEARKRKVVDKRYKHSKRYMKLLEYVIFITNVEEEKLTVKQISDIYRLRWRIEIIFKCWKSNFKLTDAAELTNKLRVDSYVYCMLIYIVLFVTDFSRHLMGIPNLSMLKLTNFIINNFDNLLYIWQHNKLNNCFIKKLVGYYCQYDKRSDRLNFSQFLLQLG